MSNKYFIVYKEDVQEEIKFTFLEDYILIENSIHGKNTLSNHTYNNNQIAMNLLNSTLNKGYDLKEFNLI